MHDSKTSHTCNRNGRFATTCNDDVTMSKPNIVKRIYHSICCGSTSGYRSIVRSHKTMFDGNVTRSNIRYHLRNEERVKTWCSIPCGKIQHLVLKCLQSTDASSPNYSNTELVYLVQIKFGV